MKVKLNGSKIGEIRENAMFFNMVSCVDISCKELDIRCKELDIRCSECFYDEDNYKELNEVLVEEEIK